MALVTLLLLVSPILGLQCFKGSCFIDKAQPERCYPPHLQATVVNCSLSSQCGLTRRVTFAFDETDDGSGSGFGVYYQSESAIAYDRDCVNEKWDCGGDWRCVSVNGTRRCYQALCCNTAFCNGDANFSSLLDDSLLTMLGDDLDDLTPTTTAPAGRDAAVNGFGMVTYLFLSTLATILAMNFWV